MDIALKQKALKQIARTAGELTQSTLNTEVEKIAAALQAETQYDRFMAQLELLDTIAYRVHEKAVDIIKSILVKLEVLELTYEELSFPAVNLKEYQTNNKLIVKALEVLEHIRYHQPIHILEIFFQYTASMNESIAKQALHGIETLASFDLDIFYADGKDWPGLGWTPQEKVLEKINSFTDPEMKTYFSGIIVACGKILSPTIEGTNWTYRTVTMRSGAVPAVEGIKSIRNQTLILLKRLYSLSDTVVRKKTVLSTMDNATRTPHMGNYSDDVRDMIMQGTSTVLQFMKTIVAKEDLQITQKIEHDTYFFYRRGVDEKVKTLALEIKTILDNRAEYQIFKALIGFEGVFTEWQVDNQEFNYEHEKTLREQKAKEFAESITEDNYLLWKERILSYARIESNDLATFPYFGRFLEYFGKISPTLALRLLLEASQQLEGFIIPILIGIWQTDKKADAHQVIESWIDENKYLSTLARFFEFTQDIDENLLTKIYSAAKVEDNLTVLNQIISTVSAQFRVDNKHLIKELFLPALTILTSHKNADWIFSVWFRAQRSEILADLNQAESQEILNNLFWLSDIDYHAEAILNPIAENYPELVVKFFCSRIASEGDGISDKYDAIPFVFHELIKSLSKIPEQAVDIVLSTYDGNFGMFIYRGANFLKNIFPDFPEPFEQKLLQLVQTKDEKNLLFVLAILRNYEGQLFLHRVCKELVRTVPDGGTILDEVTIVLQSTGVVSGEYGFVRAYEQKIEEIKPWLDEQDEKVKQFAERYKSELEERIDFEKQRAEEGILLRKYRYGTDDSSQS
jgi:hypothetical protein